MFIIAFRAGYPGANWWFVAAYDLGEPGAAQNARTAFERDNIVKGEVICFKWEWN